MNTQPQEWTPEYVHEIGAHFSIRQQRDKAIADAHNAALAAAKTDLKDMKRLYQDTYLHTIPKLEQQLATEQGKVRELLSELHTANDRLSEKQ
jgi:hypothetical protein